MTIPSSGSNDLRLKVGCVGRLRGVDPIVEACATKSISGCSSMLQSLYMLLNSSPHPICRRFMQPYLLLSVSTTVTVD